MKLSALFSKFLYQNRRLSLPGLGVFTLDPSVHIPDAAEKENPAFLQQIRFKQQQVASVEADFVDLIRKETGKIRPLAESDLESFLSDAKILLNIGKPFHLEGIGTLQKSREGTYEFTPAGTTVDRQPFTKREVTETVDHPDRQHTPMRDSGVRKLIIVALGAGMLALVVWAGYSLYNRNTTEQGGVTDYEGNIVIPPSDSSRAEVILDSVQQIIAAQSDSLSRSAGGGGSSANAGTYRFVIERTASSNRAFRRYRQIKDNLTDVRMDTSDPSIYKLYFDLPAAAADTARIRDSLKIWYGRKKVWVEAP